MTQRHIICKTKEEKTNIKIKIIKLQILVIASLNNLQRYTYIYVHNLNYNIMIGSELVIRNTPPPLDNIP